jgi:thiosulfate/3-mercaptopyruvate sulfurtransferase
MPVVEPRRFTARPQDMAVDVGQVLAGFQSPHMLIIDARNPERFRGEKETLDPVGGHIPNAVNRFYFDNLDDDGCYFKPVVELRAEFTALLAGRRAEDVVQQCGSGVTACHNLLAMELAGLSGSKLYPGSWSEWCADPARPVATG